MKYLMVLAGGVKLFIDKKRKESIEKLLEDEKEKTVFIGNDIIKTGTIKGIFEVKEDYQIDFTKSLNDINEIFDSDCKEKSEMTIDQKINNELNIRIFPAMFIIIKWINHTPKVENAIKERLRAYFTKYPKMPRCPAKIWWHLLKPQIIRNTFTTSFYEYVARNDSQNYKWYKYPMQTIRGEADATKQEKPQLEKYKIIDPMKT